MSAKCNYSGVRKERQQAAIEKHTPNMFKAFVETYQKTKSKQEAIKAAEKICPSPFALNKVLYMLPPRPEPFDSRKRLSETADGNDNPP